MTCYANIVEVAWLWSVLLFVCMFVCVCVGGWGYYRCNSNGESNRVYKCIDVAFGLVKMFHTFLFLLLGKPATDSDQPEVI